MSRWKASPIPRPSRKLCSESPAAASDADLGVRARLLRLVAVVQDERALREEEAEEARADEPGDPLRVADGLDRLRQHVEERDGDDDPARERDQRSAAAGAAAARRGRRRASTAPSGRRRGSRSSSRGAAPAGAVDVELVRLRREAVAALQLGRVGRGAELGLLDRAARDADEMVVMAGPAADVGAAALPSSGWTPPVCAEQSTVRYMVARPSRGSALRARSWSSTTVKLPPISASALEHGLSLRRHPCTRRAAGSGLAMPRLYLKMILILDSARRRGRPAIMEPCRRSALPIALGLLGSRSCWCPPARPGPAPAPGASAQAFALSYPSPASPRRDDGRLGAAEPDLVPRLVRRHGRRRTGAIAAGATTQTGAAAVAHGVERRRRALALRRRDHCGRRLGSRAGDRRAAGRSRRPLRLGRLQPGRARPAGAPRRRTRESRSPTGAT